MGELPIPAALFFDDFESEILEYNVLENNALIGTYRGLSNSDEEGNYIAFLMSEHPKISIGNTLRTIDGLETFEIYKISYDRYEGKPELIKAYY